VLPISSLDCHIVAVLFTQIGSQLRRLQAWLRVCTMNLFRDAARNSAQPCTGAQSAAQQASSATCQFLFPASSGQGPLTTPSFVPFLSIFIIFQFFKPPSPFQLPRLPLTAKHLFLFRSSLKCSKTESTIGETICSRREGTENARHIRCNCMSMSTTCSCSLIQPSQFNSLEV
jgi:hypothetical protein